MSMKNKQNNKLENLNIICFSFEWPICSVKDIDNPISCKWRFI